jgi:uncharacterized protein YjiS (DUF1127 family)
MSSSTDVTVRTQSMSLRALPAFSLIERAMMELQARRQIRQVSTLNDRTLADIGLSRGAVDYAVRHGRSY